MAALSVRGLATALVLLRGALIRTGIGALVVGAGELVYQFTRLVERVGGLGEAFRLLSDLASEVWGRVGLALDAALARMAAGWEGLKATALTALDGAITGVVSFGDRSVAVFTGAFDAMKAIWGRLPGAIGDFAFQAANGLISGVEAMLNGVVTRINSFISALNGALDLLPDWATGEGGVRIGTLDPVALGRVNNPFAGAAEATGAAAADAFSAALARSHVDAPDLGLGAAAEDARARADGYREAAGMLSDAATRPLAAWDALKVAVAGSGAESQAALNDATDAATDLGTALGDAGRAATAAGAAAGAAAAAAEPATEAAVTGWQAVTAALSDYASKAREIGGDIGQSLVGAFQSAENAVGEFVKTGKLNFRDLVTSLLADLAKLAARRFILGPIANALSGALGSAGGLFANILHAGGMVGSAGPSRMVPALAFAAAPRMHSGGVAGLRHDEVPAILQRGERVLSRREAQGYLRRKQVGPNGLRCDGFGNLIVPLRDVEGVLHTIETITPTGEKRYLADGVKAGHFCTIGEPLDSSAALLICEGWAMGASLHEVTGLPVVAAMDAGNLAPVAVQLRRSHPDAVITIVADNDDRPGREINPGVTAATKAAVAIEARLAIPPVPGDANDLAILQSAYAVAAMVTSAALVPPPAPTYPNRRSRPRRRARRWRRPCGHSSRRSRHTGVPSRRPRPHRRGMPQRRAPRAAAASRSGASARHGADRAAQADREGAAAAWSALGSARPLRHAVADPGRGAGARPRRWRRGARQRAHRERLGPRPEAALARAVAQRLGRRGPGAAPRRHPSWRTGAALPAGKRLRA